MNRFDNKSIKGFTLIEVIVTMAVFSIVMTTVFSLNLFGLRSFSSSNINAENQFEVRMPTDFIAKKIRYADKIKILNSINTEPEEGSHQIYIENGKLVYKEYNSPSTIIGTANSDDYTFTIERSNRGSNIISYRIGKNGTNKYDLKTEVIALNLKETITGDASGIYIEFFTNEADDVDPVSIVNLVNPDIAQVVLGETVSNPLRVIANMSDGTTRQVAVRWNPTKIDTSSSGYKSSSGRVVGTTDTVTFNVLVGDYTIKNIDDFTIEKNKNEEFIMPTKVQATITPVSAEDELLGEVDVLNWNNILNTSLPGTFEVKGTADKYLDEEGHYREFKLTLIVNDTPPITIESIVKMQQSILRGGTYSLPTQVVALMSDGSQSSVPVIWNTNYVNTSIVGISLYTGTVSGYAETVMLELEITNQKLSIDSVIIQEGGKDKGVVRVKGNVGATVILKDSAGKIMKYGIVIPSSGEVVITNVDTRSKQGLDNIMLTMNDWGNSDLWKLN